MIGGWWLSFNGLLMVGVFEHIQSKKTWKTMDNQWFPVRISDPMAMIRRWRIALRKKWWLNHQPMETVDLRWFKHPVSGDYTKLRDKTNYCRWTVGFLMLCGRSIEVVRWDHTPTCTTRMGHHMLGDGYWTIGDFQPGIELPSGELTFCHGKSPFLMGKSTISMAIFHCYVSSPEGIMEVLTNQNVGDIAQCGGSGLE